MPFVRSGGAGTSSKSVTDTRSVRDAARHCLRPAPQFLTLPCFCTMRVVCKPCPRGPRTHCRNFPAVLWTCPLPHLELCCRRTTSRRTNAAPGRHIQRSLGKAGTGANRSGPAVFLGPAHRLRTPACAKAQGHGAKPALRDRRRDAPARLFLGAVMAGDPAVCADRGQDRDRAGDGPAGTLPAAVPAHAAAPPALARKAGCGFPAGRPSL